MSDEGTSTQTIAPWSHDKSWKRGLVLPLLMLPFKLWALLVYGSIWKLQSLFLGRDVAFSHIAQALARIPGIRGKLLRLSFYRMSLKSCGRNVSFGFGTLLADPETEIGDHVYIGAYCSLGRVSLDDDVLLGNNVDIPSGKQRHHFERLDMPIRKQGGTIRRVRIGRDTWIGNSAMVMADVGEQSVIGGGSVVTNEIPPRSIAVGVPAKVLHQRTAADNNQENESNC